MGEARDRFEQMKRQIHQNALEAEQKQERQSLSAAMYDLANDLTYPVDLDGNQMNVAALIPFLSLHLARCGYRKDPEAAVIKQVPHPHAGRDGIAEDAVLYLPTDSTGTVPEAFIRPPEDDLSAPVNQPWKTKTHITMNGETIKGGT